MPQNRCLHPNVSAPSSSSLRQYKPCHVALTGCSYDPATETFSPWTPHVYCLICNGRHRHTLRDSVCSVTGPEPRCPGARRARRPSGPVWRLRCRHRRRHRLLRRVAVRGVLPRQLLLLGLTAASHQRQESV